MNVILICIICSLFFPSFLSSLCWIVHHIHTSIDNKGKQRRLKQAKEEAQEEIEKYRLERDRQFKEFEAKVNLDGTVFDAPLNVPPPNSILYVYIHLDCF